MSDPDQDFDATVRTAALARAGTTDSAAAPTSLVPATAESSPRSLSEPVSRKLYSSKLLTVAEVAAFFGRTERTVRNWRSRGLLRARSIGRSIFFIEDEVMALLSEADKDPDGEEPASNV